MGEMFWPAASPQGWPPLKKKVYNGKWYYILQAFQSLVP
jgi:hypothetical protein